MNTPLFLWCSDSGQCAVQPRVGPVKRCRGQARVNLAHEHDTVSHESREWIFNLPESWNIHRGNRHLVADMTVGTRVSATKSVVTSYNEKLLKFSEVKKKTNFNLCLLQKKTLTPLTREKRNRTFSQYGKSFILFYILLNNSMHIYLLFLQTHTHTRLHTYIYDIS